jgi:predicted transglutaminase-like protease
MLHIPYWKADSFAVTHEIHCVWWKKNAVYLYQDTVIEQHRINLDSVHTLTSPAWNIYRVVKLTVPQLVKKFPACYAARKFYYIAHKRMLSATVQNQINPVHTHWSYLSTILILFHHLQVFLPTYIVFLVFRTTFCKHVHTLTLHLKVKYFIYT